MRIMKMTLIELDHSESKVLIVDYDNGIKSYIEHFSFGKCGINAFRGSTLQYAGYGVFHELYPKYRSVISKTGGCPHEKRKALHKKG